LRESHGMKVRQLAKAQQLAHVELSPFGIHWPDLDEDLSFRGIADGDYGQGRTGRSGESAQGSG